MNTNDNFNELWSNLKRQVAEARTIDGRREVKSTNGQTITMNKYGDTDGAYMHAYSSDMSAAITITQMNAGELVTLAANAMSTAMDLTEAEARKAAAQAELEASLAAAFPQDKSA